MGDTGGNVRGTGLGSVYRATINDVTFIINADRSMNIKVNNIGIVLLKFNDASNVISIEE